jgi:hypothetical protein
MGSVAQVRRAARYISIEVGRSLTVRRGARPPGKTGLRRRNAGRFRAFCHPGKRASRSRMSALRKLL